MSELLQFVGFVTLVLLGAVFLICAVVGFYELFIAKSYDSYK